MNFAISTTAFRGQSILDTIKFACLHDLQLEFSSGLPHRADMESIYIEAKCKKLLHNYFPAPETPFVLNLASLDKNILSKSIEHCLKNIQLAEAAKTPFYSVHAGFCLDPSPKELGSKLTGTSAHKRSDHWKCFLESIGILLQECKRRGVGLYIENNVITQNNLCADKRNPLLCADSSEILELNSTVKQEHDASTYDLFGILVDTGHLKVSASTLGLNLDDEFRKIKHLVRAFHHSDNNGLEDSNHPIKDDYWFLKHMPHCTSQLHVIEVHNQSISELRKQIQLLEERAHVVAVTS